MRKYFDQKFKTKFSKQTMAGKEGFQWVIGEMENEFEDLVKKISRSIKMYSYSFSSKAIRNYCIR